MSHTPGPWKANKRSIRGGGRAIASVHVPREWPENHPTILADAALIAAAPELLAACEAFLTAERLSDAGEYTRSLDAVKRGIAEAVRKARGR